MSLAVQGIVALLLVVGLDLHLAEVGLIGFSVVILDTAFCGVAKEKRIGHAFEEALYGITGHFIAIVATMHDQEGCAPLSTPF